MNRNLRVKKALKEKGITQWKLAEELGMSEQTIYRKLRTDISEIECNRFLLAINSLAEKKGE